MTDLLKRGARVRLKPREDSLDFPGGLPEQFGQLLGADDYGHGDVVYTVCIDERWRVKGDRDGLVECAADMIEAAPEVEPDPPEGGVP